MINLQNIQTAHTAQLKKKNPKVGTRSKRTFLQRRHTEGQRTHEKILNITSYYRNANQNFHKFHFTLVRRAIIKNLQTINAEEAGEKREPSYTTDGNINWYSHYEVQYGGFLKI